ncbi:cyclic beta 1-2 glucan synthetase [Alcaligenaceae bacterium CGII-47]|nr:cyclic beta 1-2 glucan synthetase [Alcaligenaceae bacterium CGII-47]
MFKHALEWLDATIGHRPQQHRAAAERPLHAELFSTHQMAVHGANVAAHHKLSPVPARDLLLVRLNENARLLGQACRLLSSAVKTKQQIVPAAEWLLDNFYLIEDQIRATKKHLPPGYSRTLPRLINGPSSGLPRVYDIALEIVSHSDARVSTENLSSFVEAYQKVTSLTLGELWAIPIMLRLVLIEDLRRIAVRISGSSLDRSQADTWADQMRATAQEDPARLVLLIADMARSDPPMEGPFVAELARRLQGHGPALALPLTWIEQRLAQSGTTIEQLILSEIQQQAADQVSISNSIGSLRLLASMNWRTFVEDMSVVEQVLRQDAAGVYQHMDFATRDRYRGCIESIAKLSARSEQEVAEHAIELARTSLTTLPEDVRRGHVGYYLIDKGRAALERATGARLSPIQALHRQARRYPLCLYLGTIGLLTSGLCASILAVASEDGVQDWMLVSVAVLALVCASQLSVALVNWLSTLLTQPHPLPRMDYSRGIPSVLRTLVVVPSMLKSVEDVDELIEALEVRFLANQDDSLHFCLLTDFTDADSETLPSDELLQTRAQAGIEALNLKYSALRDDIFFLFHRPRCWNPKEGVWMGDERKRGKLAELNAFLAGGTGAAFSCIVGKVAALSGVKYVITLDTDTQLPRDTASQCVGAIAHPLNQARLDPSGQRVIEGYGILQPRVATSLPGADASLYAQLWGGEPGIDPYTRTVSDVYQDVFGEGSFVGKGIYDVEVFLATLADIPKDTVLSHDLLESCYARSGVLSDVQFYEEYPGRYSADVSRRHRWIRGDWQLLGWLLPNVPGPDGRRIKNPLSALARWKLFDNIRRSIVPPAMLLLLLLGWSSLPAPWFWTLIVIGILLIPSLSVSLHGFAHKSDDILIRQHLLASLHSAGQHIAQAGFGLVCLPFDALYHLDAIGRTIWRMVISRKHLLEWVPSQQTDTQCSGTLIHAYRKMWFAPALAIACLIYLSARQPMALWAAAPILLLWVTAPLSAWWISRPIISKEIALGPSQIAFLHRLARKTWAYFETYSGAQDNWLPPDNVQEHPPVGIAHRTSPTNIGIALLANLAAYDFGYIPASGLIERTSNTFHTLARMERHRGHFYNWYDTQSLAPLPPLYVSTVDSGNLGGHLLTLQQGLLAVIDEPVFGSRMFTGLRDTFNLAPEHADEHLQSTIAPFEKILDSVCQAAPTTLDAATQSLARLAAALEQLVANAQRSGDADTNEWAHMLAAQCQATNSELELFTAWTQLASSAEGPDRLPKPRPIPTLRELAHDQEHAPETSELAQQRIDKLEQLAAQAGDMAKMEYGFLYEPSSHLLAIGYNVSDRRRDSSYYDLLASEARLCSFVAIAQGQLPQDSWLALGRQLTTSGGGPVLLSWSGSMFEYLMPLLVMPMPAKTLLGQTCRSAVKRQIEYGVQRGVPWGISESGYNAVDAKLSYQYRAFGVPGLGLKRGLADDLVVAPYATMLALMVTPDEACRNLLRLSAAGVEGKYGFYEAMDYTPTRLPRGKSVAIIRSFMTHHQGMGFLSLAHLLLDQPMQKRFEANPAFQATLLLLHERIPKATAISARATSLSMANAAILSTPEAPVRVFNTAHTASPEVQLLSNGRYHMMVSNAGGNSSRWKDLALTRWREDATRDNWGAFCYLRDVASGEIWSTTYQPTLKTPERYDVIFSEGRAEFHRRDHGFEIHTEMVVSPEDDIELRRSHITNHARHRRVIELTSYAEVVLATSASDDLHPAFGNLFVQTEIIESESAILCTRRPLSPQAQAPWMLHRMAAHGADIEQISYETDRALFVGRGRTLVEPQAMVDRDALQGSQGSVLDPIVAIRYRIALEPEQSVTVDIVTGVADTRSLCRALIDKYQDRYLADRVFELSWTHSQVILRQLNATEANAQLYARLASSILYRNASLRADPSILVQNRQGQSGLWSYAISGDCPIVLLQVKDIKNISLVRQMVQAHAYWRRKGLIVDLVIWNEDRASYRQVLQDQITGLIAAGIETHPTDRPGGIFVRPGDQVSDEDRILLQSVALVIIDDTKGTLIEQVNRLALPEPNIPKFIPTWNRREANHRTRALTGPRETESHNSEPALSTEYPPPTPAMPARELILSNDFGGFTPDGKEYVISLEPGQKTPMPWANVLSNAMFGTLVSETGQAYTWSENAHEFRLTPWSNDAISDLGGELFYLRDEASGEFWSPTLPSARDTSARVTRHGFGYSVFEHTEGGLHSELWVYVAREAQIKFSVWKIRNDSGRTRTLSGTAYVEWVLGDLRPNCAMHVVSEIDPDTAALCAYNPYHPEFSARIGFLDVDADNARHTVTADRREFIGRNRTLHHPAAMDRARLSGKVGAGLDPCAAIQVPFELMDGEEREIVFKLGIAPSRLEASELIRQYRGPSAAHKELDAVRQQWSDILGAVQIQTPDPALDVLTNGWLMYQIIACRLWARSGLYQSGGAYGFRDQLQDVMAVVHTQPELTREHLLRCAARQFVEGDVQHWWHPPLGRGVRTRCSDDYLWLPLAVCRYVSSTGDTGVLDQLAPFLEGRPLEPDEASYYDLPTCSAESASLYQHCVRAIERGLHYGERGLPLMGSGDWNDGMDKVGIQGKGESVWLAFFLYDILQQFGPLARDYGDQAFAQRCAKQADLLRQNVEKNAWDGNWYRRAYFDDGQALGSAQSPECQIDSISQSWAVLSGAGETDRTRTAMNAVDEHLVRRDYGLIQLLNPPFDTSDLDPGYIRGYVPGIRENGGQYSHAAVWSIMAFAKLGERARTWELLQMINPLTHGATAQSTYKVEPYVMAADVYAIPPHIGRGGWTWYTGSAGWMYRLILESVLGLHLEGGQLSFTPCLPPDWDTYALKYRYRNTDYHITVTQTDTAIGRTRVTIDGVLQEGETIQLLESASSFEVTVEIPIGPQRLDHPSTAD